MFEKQTRKRREFYPDHSPPQRQILPQPETRRNERYLLHHSHWNIVPTCAGDYRDATTDRIKIISMANFDYDGNIPSRSPIRRLKLYTIIRTATNYSSSLLLINETNGSTIII